MSTRKSICRTDAERAARRVAIKENYEAFVERILPDLLTSHPGQWALLRDQKLVDVFPSSSACCTYARATFDDCIWSVQEITDAEANEGWFSYILDADEQ